MRIADYAELVRNYVLSTPYVISHSLAYEDRPPVAGVLKGSVRFADGSNLSFKEFVHLGEQGVQLKYAYHYVSSRGNLVFRYDNARDPAAKYLSSYPDHKHLPDGIHPSHNPSLKQVLREAAQHVKRP